MFHSVEEVFESIGGFSRYQKWITIILVLPQIPMAMIILSPNFTGSSKVQLLCNKNHYTHDETDACTAKLNCTYSTTDFQYTSIVQEWDLVCAKSWVADTITSFSMAGMVLGIMVSSVMADLFGRKKCYLIQMTIMGVCGMLPCLTEDPWTYAFTRFLAGFGCGGGFSVFPAHHMEFLTPSWRTIVGTLGLWPLGEILLALVSYEISSWRYITLASAAPALLMILFHPLVLESPRWLLSKNRTTEAQKVFEQIAQWNSKPLPDSADIQALQDLIASQGSTQLRKSEELKLIFTNKKLLKQLAFQTFCVVTCTTVYYGVSFSAKDLGGSPYLNMMYMGILDFISSPASILTNNRIGRKLTFILYMSSGALFICCNIVLKFLYLNHEESNLATHLVVAFSLCGRFAISAAWGSLRVIVLETAPTDLRVSYMGLTEIAGNLAAVLSPQLIILGTIFAPFPHIILGLLTVLGSISSLFFIDMTRKPLGDIILTEMA